MKTIYSYSDAFHELQQIVAEIERGDIAVDDLAVKIKRSTQLIQICKAKLTASEEEVNELLAKLEEPETTMPLSTDEDLDN